MDAERWQRVERLYHAALEPEPECRAAFLQENCGGDEELRREVEEMLALAERHASFLERPALEIAISREGMSASRLRLAFETAIRGRPGGEFRLDPHARLGPYEIIQLAGAGGMGEVYRARDTRLNRVVALKVLSGRLVEENGIARRFEAEAQSISRLNHPNICTLYDIGRQDDLDYLVMEYLEGQTLAMRLRQGTLPYAELLHVAIEISGALAYAHSRGVIHRDVKPSNVMLTAFGAKLLDFGLARWGQEVLAAIPLAADASTSASSMIIGTPQYMSPEQIERREVDARTDVFALGVVLYEMAAGKKPFQGETSGAVMSAILHETPAPVSQVNPEIHLELQEVIAKALEKDPEARYQNAADLRADLQRLERDMDSSRRRADIVPARRISLVMVLVAIAAVALMYLLRLAGTQLMPLQPSPRRISLQYQGSGPAPTADVDFGDVAARFSVNSGAAWLSVDSSTGNHLTRLHIVINPNGLAPKGYDSEIRVRTGDSRHAEIPVHLDVSSGPLVLRPNPSSIQWDYRDGDPAPVPVPIVIPAVQPASIHASWQNPADARWFHCDLAQGALRVSVQTRGMTIGPHTAMLVLDLPGAVNTPVSVPVSVNIQSALSLSAAQESIHWKGVLNHGEVLTVRGMTCSTGELVTGEMPARQIRTTLFPPVLAVEAYPSAGNHFTLRLRNTGAAPVTDFTLFYRAVR